MEVVQPGGGTGGTGKTLTPEIPIGTVDDSNTIFTVTHDPVYIVVNSGTYITGTGIFASYAAGTITLSSAIGTRGFIISFYNA